MTTIHGFDLLRDETVNELNTRARLYRHLQTGAQLLSLENDDENKVFGITFRTPPPDSTGIAHILEHSVLGGSRKYPLKEPFVQLIKGSLKTFLNAMTFPDRTAYPVASTNLKDFYNLVDVYLDAVFYPLITPQHLQQEGWHYELTQIDDPLTYKGVVYNEMKGAYSSPDNLLYRTSQQSLFPNNIYGLDSGGDPLIIPQLTYDQFKGFHTTFYHPSNALIYHYGDDDPTTRLRNLDAVLHDFQAAPVAPLVPLQPPFGAPQQVSRAYGIDANSPAKSMVQVNWLLPEGDDPALVMGLSLLSYALIGTQASPLRKALIDSGLGEDVTGGGLSTGLRQMTFSAGLKGVNPAQTGAVEPLILATLASLVNHGIDPDMIAAAFNTIEFSLRENNTGSSPRGLSLMMRALRTWLYDRDPLSPLAFEAPLAAVRQRLDTDPVYLSTFIRSYLLDNQHRTTVILEPDPDFNSRLAADEEARLAEVRAGLSQTDLQAIIANTQALKRLQETPDSPAALATLPTLTLGDLDKQIKTIPLALNDAAGDFRLLYHDLFTNGIVYLDLAFDLHALPAPLLPYAKLFGQALVEMGTTKEDFVKLAQRIGRETGGIHPSNFLSAKRDDAEGSAWFMVHAKATMAQTKELLAILHDILLMVKLDDHARFRQIVLKSKAGKESGLIPGGSAIVESRLRASFHKAEWAAEQMGGVSHLFLRELLPAIENDWPNVLDKLEIVRRLLINRSGMIANVTLDAANWVAFEPQLRAFLAALPAALPQTRSWTPDITAVHEGLTIPAQVNYVGKGANLYDLGYQLHGSVQVITNFLRTTWLWDKVRVQGGAYGGFCRFSQQSGVLCFLSYRDPNLLATLDVYDQTARFLRDATIGDDELTKSIIGAIGALDAYQLPDAKGYTSLARYLLAETDENRQRRRHEILSTTAAHFTAFAGILDAVRDQGSVVVMGSPTALATANATRANWLTIQKVL